MAQNKVLFILKRKQNFNPDKDVKIGLTTGLYNSAYYMNEMLLDSGIESHMEVAIDNNCIDRMIVRHKPTHVIIEALWVTPEKFTVLNKLHPNVKWIIRLHSEIPFLANEGMAMDWLGDYAAYDNVILAMNAPRTVTEIAFYLSLKMGWSEEETNRRVTYLPNYYPQGYQRKPYLGHEKDILDIGCFGAVRPLKNHMMQAIAAVMFAETIGKKVNFHINAGRVEQKGESVLRNLMCFFAHLQDRGHQLIQHDWLDRDGFLDVCGRMDLAMQVSLSETFNIVGADVISQGVPLIASHEIPWLNPEFAVKSIETSAILDALVKTHHNAVMNIENNQKDLTIYTSGTRDIWYEYFK